MTLPSWCSGSDWTGWIAGQPRLGDLAAGTLSVVRRPVSDGRWLQIAQNADSTATLYAFPNPHGSFHASVADALTAANTLATSRGGWGSLPTFPSGTPATLQATVDIS